MTAPAGKPTPEGRSSELDWLLTIVSGGHDSVSGQATPARAPSSSGDDFAIIPSARRPKLLVPLGSPRAAARAVRVRDYGVGRQARVARTLLALGLRAGGGQLLRPRITLPSPASPGEPSLVDHLRAVLGRCDIEAAIRIGRVRPNRKPLVALVSGDGGMVGYAKLGWNDVTRALVRNEAAVLTALASGDRIPERFVVPPVLHLGAWRNLEVLIVSALPATTWNLDAHAQRTHEAMLEMSRGSARSTEQLGRSAYWARQLERAGAAGGSALPGAAERIAERHGELELEFGAWHGDWGPWNMGGLGDRIAVWDWERSGSDVPFGIDAAHFDFHLELGTSNRPVDALRRVCANGRPMLARLGLPPRTERAVLALDLLEMSLRHVEGTFDHPEQAPQHAALEALLEAPD